PGYTRQYYEKLKEGSRRSAKVVVPLVMELVAPSSVIDIGCGVGIWLSVFREYGLENVMGIDGDHVDRSFLEIPDDCFRRHDLRLPFELDSKFDLIMSLEVAEHLPPKCAEMFVDMLVRLGSVILFSAAIPFQGGENHMNEQWPEYWVKYFQLKKYVVIDCIRKKVWSDDQVDWWYAQNLLMFVQKGSLNSYPRLKKEWENTNSKQLSIVHPKAYLHTNWMKQVYRTATDIVSLIPAGHDFILVDDQKFGGKQVYGNRHAIPFIDSEGPYKILTPDDDEAVREVERLACTGASFMVFGWPAFWWLDYYFKLHLHLRSKYRCVFKNDRIIVFDLR
ncbi:class I SAM-dependent methyltransferase, partial [bacterium]|nr:class I SAM-dependent methyltransferase [bacterium]